MRQNERCSDEHARRAGGRLTLALACAGAMGFGSGGALAQNTMLVTDSTGNKVVRFDYPSGAVIDHFVGAAISPLLNGTFMTINPDGNLLVGSYNNDEVDLYNGQTGQFISTFIPTGRGGLNGTMGLVYGPDGNLYVASNLSDQVLKYNGDTGAFLSVAATGIDGPDDIAFSPDGRLYVCGNVENHVAIYDPATGTRMGNVDTTAAPLSSPVGIAINDAGVGYVTNAGNHTVIKFNTSNDVASVLVPAFGGGLSGPRDVALDNAGNLLIPSRNTGDIKMFNSDGVFLENVVTAATDGALGTEIWGVALYTPGAGCTPDLNHDGTLNFFDVSAFIQAYTAGCP